jgi:hypothetical protein
VPLSWQANDPLVHYMAGDLYDTKASGIVTMIDPAQVTPVGSYPVWGPRTSVINRGHLMALPRQMRMRWI